MTTEFPAVFKVVGGDTSQAERQVSQGIDRITQSGRQKLGQFSQEAQRLLDQALSVQRNDAGSLDLQVGALREAATAQEQRAVAARELADATLRAARADGVFNQEMRDSVAAVRQLATEEERLARRLRSQVTAQEAVQRELNQTKSATDALIQSRNRGTTASSNVINSVRAERTAFIQLGQQLQDVTIQAQLGTNAFQIFAQQVPQAAFALSGLDRSASSFKRTIGTVATFLSGPWGAAIFAATAVLGPYVAKLFEGEKAAQQNSDANQILAERLDQVRGGYEEVLAAIRDYNAETERASETSLQAAQRAALLADQKFREALATREALAAKLVEAEQDNRLAESTRQFGDRANLNVLSSAIRLDGLTSEIEQNQARLNALREDVNLQGFNLATEQAKLQTDASAAIVEAYVNERQALAALGLDRDEARERLIALNRAEQAELDALRERSPRRRSNRRAENEARRLRDFAASAAREIETIENRFVEIPVAVAQVNNSVTQLDDLIAELAEREPPGFEPLIEQAKAARDELADFGVYDGLRLALADITLEGAQQLEQQALILTGRRDEAEVLRIMTGLQRQFGGEVENHRETVEAIVEARSREREELDRIDEQLGAYRQATQSIRQELEGLFSGEGADFEQVFRRLQARISVETIFGDALQQLDDTVQREFDQAVERLSDGVIDAEQALDRLVGALTGSANRISGASPQGSSEASRAAFNAEFDRAFSGAVSANNRDQIVVQRLLQDVRDGVSGMSPELYARLLGDALVTPLVAQLPSELSIALRNTLGPALGGLSAAGPAGAGIGLLEGLLGTDGLFKVGDDIAQSVSAAFDGLFTGTQTSALLTSFGIGNSSTGSALGGAIGSAAASQFGGILGNVLGPIGALAGGFLVDAFSGQARGSARIGAQGDGLGVVGFFGGNDQREQQSAQFANTAIETIERLAEQLGSSLNTAVGQVSIGIRDDNIRVDTAGRGFTKLSGNPEVFDFGSDAEAALLFAVQDLINDGVIAGLSAAEANLIRSGQDIERAIQDVLTFRSVSDRLEGLDNPLGAEIAALNNEFRDLIDLFERAGASAEQFADLERLYDLERAQLVEDATDRIAGSLRSLIDDLTIGDNGFSLRTRQANAEARFDGLAARVASGDTSAFDDFEESARALLDIERQLFGSQERYFDRVEEVLALSQNALDDQQAAINQSAAAGSPFADSRPEFDLTPIGLPLAQQNDILTSQLGAVNANLGTIIRLVTAQGGGFGGRSGEPRTAQFAF